MKDNGKCLRCVTPAKCAIHGCTPHTWPAEPGAVAWRYVPSDVWGDQLVTQDRKTSELARSMGREVQPLIALSTKPTAWVRFCSDGTYEGPLMDCQMEEVRKKSGAWTPLFALSL